MPQSQAAAFPNQSAIQNDNKRYFRKKKKKKKKKKEECSLLCGQFLWNLKPYFTERYAAVVNDALPASVAQSDAFLTGNQEVAGSIPTGSGNILSWRLIMKYILRSISPFRWFKKGSCQFLVNECAQILINRLAD